MCGECPIEFCIAPWFALAFWLVTLALILWATVPMVWRRLTGRRRAAPVGLLAGSVVTAALGTLIPIGMILVAPVDWGRERLAKAKVGMTEEEVVEILGRPDQVLDEKTAPEHYDIEGWAYEERPISNEVYIYRGGEPIAYVYIDHENRVEYVFVGGS